MCRSLAIKVSNCKYRNVIERCTARGEVFHGCNRQFLNTLLMKLKLVFYMPHEEIFKKDDLARELAMVHYGACFIYEDEKVSRVVRHDVSLSHLSCCHGHTVPKTSPFYLLSATHKHMITLPFLCV